MPHVIIEHSDRAATVDALQTLCDAMFDQLAAHDAIAHPESLKIRTVQSGVHRLGTEPQSFAHATLLLLPGRSPETKAALAQLMLSVLQTHLGNVGSLSVNLSDLDPTYAKRVL